MNLRSRMSVWVGIASLTMALAACGGDAAEAKELIAGRPYASAGAFLEALGAYVSGEEQTAAETYLTTL